jgi:hypothetical protein
MPHIKTTGKIMPASNISPAHNMLSFPSEAPTYSRILTGRTMPAFSEIQAYSRIQYATGLQ